MKWWPERRILAILEHLSDTLRFGLRDFNGISFHGKTAVVANVTHEMAAVGRISLPNLLSDRKKRSPSQSLESQCSLSWGRHSTGGAGIIGL